MAYMVKYQMDTNTYQIKHATSCESCRNKTGNSIAVMKIVINDGRNYTYPKIIMKTGERGRHFAIRFHNLDYTEEECWGHLTVPQSKRLIKDLKSFIARTETK